MIAGLALVCVILGISAPPASARGPWQRVFSDDFEHGLDLRVDFQVDWVRIDRYRPGRSGRR